MFDFNPMFAIDFYKADHRSQYPKGTNLVYSNFTPRSSRVEGVNHMVFFGLQYLVKEYLVRQFNNEFFMRPKNQVVAQYKHFMDHTLGKDSINVEHIAQLHDLGYLPIKIKAVPEGTCVPLGTPAMTLYNTHPDFFWLTNYLETLLSASLWKMCTSATTAREFRLNFNKYARETGGNMDFTQFQGHDFSFRGMSGVEDACMCGLAHLTCFTGTDTVPAILFAEEYYNADRTKELIGCSIPATEHSVMSAGGYRDEFETYKRLLTQVYPDGLVSIVSDTWDFWNVITDFLPRLKDVILNRGKDTGKFSRLVVRPDTGTPHKVICGDPESSSEPEKLGLARCLDRVFGHTVNSMGFKDLHPCIGYIYGDSINLQEQVRILEGLKNLGYSTTSCVLGVGSYTYQYVTRDTYGTVCKATYCEVNGEPRAIFKSPKTGAWKKSHKGLLRVNADLSVSQEVTWEEEGQGVLTTVFENGIIVREDNLANIRRRMG
jgi:nicotinamide phosphoribosyltransferase